MSQLNTIEARITQKSGTVYVEREGERLTLEIGDAIYESDLIITGPGTTAEIQYIDGTMSRLAPETQMRLVDFEYDATVNSENSFLVDIAEGAMRTVTGEIVKLNPDAFEIVTPRATVGIRGTDIATQINDDGSETHVIISIGKGHRVEITTHDGQLMSLYSSNEGAFIPVDLDGEIKPYIFNFTTEEINEIINHIENAVSDEQIKEDEEGLELEQDHSSIIIDQTTIDALGSEIIEALTNSLESAGLTVLLPEETLALETVENEVILVPGEPDGPEGAEYIDASFDGVGSYYADGNDMNLGVGGSFSASKTRINITQDISSPTTVVSGDVNNIISGTVNAADDIITGTTMSNGRVVGDAQNVSSGATLIAGNDEITFDSKTGGFSIYADAHTIATGATASFGDDTVTIRGSLQNSAISGDAHTVNGNVIKWGNDVITVGSMDTSIGPSTNIYGDYAIGNYTSGGNDTITVLGNMVGHHPINIYGNGGDDLIRVNSFERGTIDGGAGDDVIEITTIDGILPHEIITGTGDDIVRIENHNETITITNESYSASGGLIAGGTDSIFFANNITSEVTLKSDNSSFFELYQSEGNLVDVTSSGTLILSNSMNISLDEVSGQVTGSTDSDTISITRLMSGGSINGGAGNDDQLTVTSSGTHNLSSVSNFEKFVFSNSNDNITLSSLSGVTSLNGGGGTDTLTVTNNGSHSLTNVSNIENYIFSTGNDNITISNFSNIGNLNGGGGADTLTVTNNGVYNLSNLSNVSGIDTFVFKTLFGNTLTGTSAADNIIIENLNGGTLNTGDGIDTIIIDNLTGTVSIDLGEGLDYLTATLSGNVDIDIDVSDIAWEVPELTLTSGVSGRIDMNGWSFDQIKITDASGTLHDFSTSNQFAGTSKQVDGLTIYFNA